MSLKGENSLEMQNEGREGNSRANSQSCNDAGMLPTLDLEPTLIVFGRREFVGDAE